MLSIIVPVYNCARSLNRCIDSILHQTYEDIEIILVNDGSNDNSLDICKQYESVLKNITVVSQENKGVSAARNAGIRRSKGEYLTFVDSDDYLQEDYIAHMMEKLDENTDLIVAGHQIIDGSGRYLGSANAKEGVFGRKDFSKLVYILLSAGNFNQPYGKIYKKEKINSYFDEYISLGEDLLFVENYLLECHTVSVCGNDGYMYVSTNEYSLSNKYFENGIEIYTYLYKRSMHFLNILSTTSYNTKKVFAEKYLNNLLDFSEKTVLHKDGKALIEKLSHVSRIIQENKSEFKNVQLFSKKNRYCHYLQMDLYYLFITEVSIRFFAKRLLKKVL